MPGQGYRADGDFLRMLDGLGYRFFDDDGNVYSVDNATEQPSSRSRLHRRFGR